MRSWKQWSLVLVLATAVAQWALTLVPSTGEARGRESAPASTPSAPAGGVEGLGSAQVLGLFFTPPSGAGKALVTWIDGAREEVLVQAYGFTHNAIAQALLRAQQRGVRVAVLLDRKSSSTNRYVIDLLQGTPVALRFDGEHAIAHNKLMLIDEQVVITGSFNFTNAAETRNAENLLILRSSELAQVYKQQWLRHWAHSQSEH